MKGSLKRFRRNCLLSCLDGGDSSTVPTTAISQSRQSHKPLEGGGDSSTVPTAAISQSRQSHKPLEDGGDSSTVQKCTEYVI